MIDSTAPAQNEARDAARSSGQAVSRASDSYTGVEHHHTPPKISGSGVSAVSKPSGPGMARRLYSLRYPKLASPMIRGSGESDTSCMNSSGQELWRYGTTWGRTPSHPTQAERESVAGQV
eukprot:343033-Pleurochrysis_carterae.AAC.1